MRLVDGRYVDEDKPEQEPVPELVASGREPPRVNRWLVVALVVAVAVAGTLGGLWYLDHRQTPEERAVTELVAAYEQAWNSGDTTALLSTMTSGGSFSVIPGIGQTSFIAGPFAGVELADFANQMHGMDFTVTTTGGLVIVSGNGGWTAVQPVRISYRERESDPLVEEAGWDLFTVVDDHGAKLILQAFWWPTDY
jgi:hypothetical protein